MNKKNDSKIIKFPSSISQIEKQVEAILFAAEEPLDIDTIEKRVGSSKDIKKTLLKLQGDYSKRGINLVCVSNKWIFRTAVD